MSKRSALLLFLLAFCPLWIFAFEKKAPFDVCNNINWANWGNFNGRSATGSVFNGSENVNVTMTSNFDFSSTPDIYNHTRFSTYPSAIPNRTVTVNPNIVPSLNITASTTNICVGGSIRFSPNYSNAGTNPTFKWFKNGAQVSSTENYIADGLQNDDEVYCEITGSTPCSVPFISNKIKITVNALPTVSFGENLVIENDGPKTLNPEVSENVVSYSWFPKTGLDNPNIKNPKVSPESTTEYTLTVTGPGGCSAEATTKVVVLKDIFIPKVFSPNGDGKNNQWVIRNISDYVGTKVQIFNRYGQQVFQNDNFITPWDGFFSGKPLPVGSYYYILDLANKSKTRYTGSVTILR